MTIAISLKVHEGVVLATDSASTLTGVTPDGQMTVVNVYDNANKIVNLVKGLPVGVMTWGAGAIGPSSITTIFKDLRAIFSGAAPSPDGDDWILKADSLSIEAVANRVMKYVVEGLYAAQFGTGPGAPGMGILIAGYSTGGTHAEEFEINVTEGGLCSGPQVRRPGPECGFTVGGQPMAVSRLILGVDPGLGQVLEQGLGVPHDQVAPALAVIQNQLQVPVVQDAMPFQDALDLAHFLVDATIKMTRFLPGPSTVGGPIEIAGITKHEGFKWVARKHYFDTAMNPRE